MKNIKHLLLVAYIMKHMAKLGFNKIIIALCSFLLIIFVLYIPFIYADHKNIDNNTLIELNAFVHG